MVPSQAAQIKPYAPWLIIAGVFVLFILLRVTRRELRARGVWIVASLRCRAWGWVRLDCSPGRYGFIELETRFVRNDKARGGFIPPNQEALVTLFRDQPERFFERKLFSQREVEGNQKLGVRSLEFGI